MISRRGFFGMLAGLAAAPWLPKQVGPPVDFFRPGSFHKEYIIDDDVYGRISYSQYFIDSVLRHAPFLALLKEKPLPFSGGQTIQFFTYGTK